MEMQGTPMFQVSASVIFLSSILGGEEPNPCHKCDWKCQNDRVCGNMYRCSLTGLTHICDKNCNQRILYDNHSCLCRVSGQIFSLTAAEEHAVRGVRRKLADDVESEGRCSSKRRRDAKCHPSPFERSFVAVSPICSQVGDGMDLNQITAKCSNRFCNCNAAHIQVQDSRTINKEYTDVFIGTLNGIPMKRRYNLSSTLA